MTTREVELSGGAPWGFRMHGGVDQNQPLRISRVNPGSKASISGIREGDIISSINTRPTRTMSNADAHAMLRNAGPVLRLGLNEGREMSPRHRSIGKSCSDIKRPSHLVSERDEATPQAPVYSTIRPSLSHQKSSSSPLKLPPTSIPTSYTCTGLTNSSDAFEEPPRFHPTNPFYSTLPSHSYSSASKLPIPNGKTIFSSLDRSKPISKTNESISTSNLFDANDYHNSVNDLSRFNLQNPTQIKTNGYESNTSDERNKQFNSSNINGVNSKQPNGIGSVKQDPNEELSANKQENIDMDDPFEQYIKKLKEKNSYDSFKIYPESPTVDKLNPNRKEIHRSTITEHKIDRVEEVKTIKKFVFNGGSDAGHNGTTSSEYTLI